MSVQIKSDRSTICIGRPRDYSINPLALLKKPGAFALIQLGYEVL
jgi:hypothetical protein